jgi:NAD(P)-dependent dehydrogenase (short-subunit alcohol dehydrogenase family)
MKDDLRGKICVVTGASRGAGKGIALALGEAGATVYLTGRSTRGAATRGYPGSIEETAAEVEGRGGRAIALRCDHTSDEEVARLFAQVAREGDGRLDLLVNNAWMGHDGGTDLPFGKPFWERPDDPWPLMMDGGARLALRATRHAAPLFIARGSGLIVDTTFGLPGDRFMGDIYYDLAKATITRLTLGMAESLRPHGVACVALSPGFMRTELVLASAGAESLQRTESVEYVGRAVAALMRLPDPLARTGERLFVADLARELGFTDVDGTQPPIFEV